MKELRFFPLSIRLVVEDAMDDSRAPFRKTERETKAAKVRERQRGRGKENDERGRERDRETRIETTLRKAGPLSRQASADLASNSRAFFSALPCPKRCATSAIFVQPAWSVIKVGKEVFRWSALLWHLD